MYYILSVLFPAHETFMDAAVLPDDVVRSPSLGSVSDDAEKASIEKEKADAEVRTAESERN